MARKTKRTVAAVGTAVSSRAPRAADIEAAMAQAIKDARAEGISDPAKIRARMLAARDRVKQAG